jgi:hypothetical protein
MFKERIGSKGKAKENSLYYREMVKKKRQSSRGKNRENFP